MANQTIGTSNFEGPGDMFTQGGATRAVMQRASSVSSEQPVYFILNVHTMMEECESTSLAELFELYGAPTDVFRSDDYEIDFIM